MSVDYRLLPCFEDSRRRHEDAREALPLRWRSDPRPEVQLINDLWVSIVARARAHLEHIDFDSRIPGHPSQPQGARRPPVTAATRPTSSTEVVYVATAPITNTPGPAREQA